MSWFDTTAFTSYAKTALATAQKSIDKVLDIEDDGSSNKSQSSKTTNKVKEDAEKHKPLQTSTPKPSSSSSAEKLINKGDVSEDGGNDFWSSFLGTPDSSTSSANSRTSSARQSRSKTTLTKKLSDSKLTTEKKSKKSLTETIGTDIKDVKEEEKLSGKDKGKESNKKDSEKGIEKNETQNGNKLKGNKNDTKEKDSSGQKCVMQNDDKEKNVIQNENIKPNVDSLSANKSTDLPDVLEYDINRTFKEQKGISPKKRNINTLNNSKDSQSKDESEKNKDELTSSKENLSDVSDSSINKPNVQNIETTIIQPDTSKDFKVSSNATVEDSKDSTDNDTKQLSKMEQENSGTGTRELSDQSSTDGQKKSNLKILPNQDEKDSDLDEYYEAEISLESAKTSETQLSKECPARTLKVCSETDNDIRGIEMDTSNDKESSIKAVLEHCKDEEKVPTRREPVEDECTEDGVVTGVILSVEDEDDNADSVTTDAKVSNVDYNNDSNVYTDQQEQTESSEFVEFVLNKDQSEKGTIFSAEESDYIIEQEQIQSSELVRSDSSHDNNKKGLIFAVEETVDENNFEIQKLKKEISKLRELVDARENKMLSLSKENIDHQETIAILRSQIDQLESIQAGDNEEFEEMREEFTTRISRAENKLHEVEGERDQLRNKLEETTAHLNNINQRQKEEYTTLIAEKDEQIAQLLSEGEKLSKQELQSNTVIKKLRAKEKENEALIKKQTKKLEEYADEVKRLTDILTTRDDSNSKQEDTIYKLNAYVKKQDEKIAEQTSELDDAQEKLCSLQSALDNAYKEMTSLQKQTASSDSAIQEAVLSAEMKAKEELRMALEKTKREYLQESEMMALQVTDLQASLTRSEQQSTRREESLRQEIKHLQQRLQEAEDRNQELATSVSHATRPLLRQIENLQTTHSGQAATWEKVEKNLTDRLNEAQNQLHKAQEKERTASQGVTELNARITRLESQVSSYRAERSRLEAELELEINKVGTLEDASSRESAKYDAMVKKYQKLIEDANLDKAHLEQQLTVERSKMDTDLKKMKATLEEKEKLLTRQSSFSNVSPPSTSNEEWNSQQDTTGNPSNKGHSRTSSSSSSVVDGFSKGMIMGSTTALVERLQAQVRQKEGEIELLQDDVTSLHQSRDSVLEELTSMTAKLEMLETTHDKYKELKEKHDALEQRYNAVLQMYGEKEEEAEELRMDLQDVKSMYKQQLEQLFGTR